MKRKTTNRIQLQQALLWDMDKKPNDAVPEQGTECGTGVTLETMENFTGAEALPVMKREEQHRHPWCKTSPHHIQEDFLVWFGVFVDLCWVFCLFILAFHPLLL